MYQLSALVAIVVAIIALAAGFYLQKNDDGSQYCPRPGSEADKLRADAAREIETMQRAAQVEAREEAQKLRESR